jgi:protein-disulfide isomerase
MVDTTGRRGALKLLGAGGIGLVAGAGGTAYYAQQFYAETNDPDNVFGGPPPELATQIRGESGPIVTVYVDYSCPHCHDFETGVLPELDDAVENGEMRILPRVYPLPVDKTWSWRMPNVPRSAQAQTGSLDGFWEARDYIWNNWSGGNFSESYVRDLATELGLDPDRTWRETKNEWYRPYIELDRELGAEDGVDRTPTVIVDGEIVQENSVEAIEQAVDQARE